MSENHKKGVPTEAWRQLSMKSFILHCCTTICGTMVQQNFSDEDLFIALKRIKSRVTREQIGQIVKGDANLKMDDLADIFLVLGSSVHLKLLPLIDGYGNRVTPPTEHEKVEAKQ